MPITVLITTWRVPFDQVVSEIKTFDDNDVEGARLYINVASSLWWDENEGPRWVAECRAQDVEVEDHVPIKELGYDMARYEIGDGEAGFHAMIDEGTYWRLHEAHYKREYDDQGLTRPGYLINTYVAGENPEITDAEREKYAQQQAEGMAAIESHYGGHTKQ
jgi:hypothetical protein